MFKLDEELYYKASLELVQFYSDLFSEGDISIESETRAAKAAKISLHRFLDYCSKVVTDISKCRIENSNNAAERESEEWFWNAYINKSRSNMVQLGTTLGLKEETAETVITSVVRHLSH